VQRFGELTAATVLQLLLPLLIILLSFAAFAGEREQGTLRQLLSLGVPVKALAWGKALGIAGALCVLIVPAALLGVVALALTSENGMLEASAARLGWMLASYLLYFGIFIGFSLAVSARARSAQFALLALLAGWIINGLIAPRALADLARVAFPTPSAFAFQQAIDRDMKGDGHDLNEALKRRVLAEYKVSRVEELPVNFAGLSLQESEVHGNAIFDRHFSVLWNTYEQQDRLKQTAGIMAPMLAISSLSRGLAGTDFAQHRDFAQAAEQYRRLFIKQMNDDMTYHAGKQDFTYLAHPAVWASVPDFKYEAPATSWVLRQQRISLALLALWFMAAVFIALLATRRMRIV
jgi:ABC-2 type transport system permease protein